MAQNNGSANATAIAVLQNINIQLGQINQTLKTLFPSADNQVSVSAGAPSGNYLTITIAGVNYKLELLDEA